MVKVRALQKCYIGNVLYEEGQVFDVDLKTKELPAGVLAPVSSEKVRRKPERPDPDE